MFVTRGHLAWVQDDGTVSGLSHFTQELEQKYSIFKAGSAREGTELKCHLAMLGFVSFVALACGTGLLIRQIEGGFYPAMCLFGISVGFVVGMVIAWRVARNKQKIHEQTLEKYQNEDLPFEIYDPVLEQVGEASLQKIVDRLSEKKAQIPFQIAFYKMGNIPSKVDKILKFGVIAIPSLSETEKASLIQFLAYYEKKIFDERCSQKDLHDQFLARINYLSQHPAYVKANLETAKRYFNLYINSALGLEIFLDTLMEQHPDLLIPCKVQLEDQTLSIPLFRLFTLSPIFANLCNDLNHFVPDPDTPLLLDLVNFELSEGTARKLLNYLKYGKLDTLPFHEQAFLAQFFELDELIEMLPSSMDLSDIKIGLQNETHEILMRFIHYIFKNPENAQSFKSPESKDLNQFIDAAVELKKSIWALLLKTAADLVIVESPQWGKYFLKTFKKYECYIACPLTIEQLSWLTKYTACGFDSLGAQPALEQCIVCLDAGKTTLAKTFLNCANEKIFSTHERLSCSIESMVSLYQFASDNHAFEATRVILQTLQAKEKAEDIAAILAAGANHQFFDWICIGFELITHLDKEIAHEVRALSFQILPTSISLCIIMLFLWNIKVKYQSGERRLMLTVWEDSFLEIVVNLHDDLRITHICAKPEIWDSIGNQLDHLQMTKVSDP
jgi:hypothetical protein